MFIIATMMKRRTHTHKCVRLNDSSAESLCCGFAIKVRNRNLCVEMVTVTCDCWIAWLVPIWNRGAFLEIRLMWIFARNLVFFSTSHFHVLEYLMRNLLVVNCTQTTLVLRLWFDGSSSLEKFHNVIKSTWSWKYLKSHQRNVSDSF